MARHAALRFQLPAPIRSGICVQSVEALRSVLLLAQEAFVLGDASFAQREVHSSTVFVESSIEVGPASLKIQSKSLAHEIDQELFESPN